MLLSLLSGLLGGILRGLVGIGKLYRPQRTEAIRASYLIVTLGISALVGLAAGALVNTDWRISFLAGYAGTDLPPHQIFGRI